MNLEREITASLLRIQLKSPFFATIALHARFVSSLDVPTMATDGRDVFVNPEFAASLPREHLDGVLLHEVLHAALGHVTRRGVRDPQGWNIAADIVVNGLVTGNGFFLPDGAVIATEYQDFSTEEVYAILAKSDKEYPEVALDLLEPTEDGPDESKGKKGSRGKLESAKDTPAPPGALPDAKAKSIEEHWRKANAQAAAVARTNMKGALPAGVERAFGHVDDATQDWRSVLWQFLSPTTSDFAAFDRRHIHSGLYLETLEDQGLLVAVCVDTSGSIDEESLCALMTEVQSVLGVYPNVTCWLYYADASVYGPWILGPHDEIPPAQGGGGTDFRPFFESLSDATDNGEGTPNVAVYLTDGFGDFPEPECLGNMSVLWAVTAGGLADELFPFGQVIRLV